MPKFTKLRQGQVSKSCLSLSAILVGILLAATASTVNAGLTGDVSLEAQRAIAEAAESEAASLALNWGTEGAKRQGEGMEVSDGSVGVKAEGIFGRLFSFHRTSGDDDGDDDSDDEGDDDGDDDHEEDDEGEDEEKEEDEKSTIKKHEKKDKKKKNHEEEDDECEDEEEEEKTLSKHEKSKRQKDEKKDKKKKNNEEEDDDNYDCDNGDDSDDGHQWEIKNQELDPASGFQNPVRTRFSRTAIQGLEPFPQWLTDITGLTQWPGHNIRFIPQAGIDLTNIPDVPLRELGDCSAVTLDHCSFDCFRCLSLDEIVSCPVLSQTFDDGPSPATPKLLDQLPTKSTFFTQGINVIRFPETFRRQHAEGHLLASHTWSHANLAGVSNEQVAAQIQWSIWAMNATAGVVPRYFRPPYGASDNRVRAIARQFGLVSVFWDHDTFDWQINDQKKTPMKVLEEVSEWKNETPNGLILEHDSTIDTVNVGVDISKILGERQYTVAECVNGRWYQNI